MNSCAPTIPQNIEAEVGVLGAMLLEESIVGDILPLLDKSYFLSTAHQCIFEVIGFLFDNNKPIGPITVQEELKKRGYLEQIGGVSYLFSLMESVFSAGSALQCAKIVREKGIMRQLIRTAEKIKEDAQSDQWELDTLLDRAEQAIFEVTQKSSVSDPSPLHDILIQLYSEIEQGSGVFRGVSSGFTDLDKLLTGFQNSSLVIIAGRPSMGKTSFALNIAAHVALYQKVGVLIFSLEMSREQLAQNLVCAYVHISPHIIRSGVISNENIYRTLTDVCGTLGKAPLFIDDTPSISLREIKGKARRFKARHNIGLVVVDYIQLIEGGTRRVENRQQEISHISRGLKNMARELDLPVVALSQLNRSVDAREDHRPRLSDLRESGALEQDADVIIFLYRDEYYNKDSHEKGIADIIVAKHRNGPVGEIKLAFQKEYMLFTGLSYTHSVPK